MGIALILYIDRVILYLVDLLVIEFQGVRCQAVSGNSHLELHLLLKVHHLSHHHRFLSLASSINPYFTHQWTRNQFFFIWGGGEGVQCALDGTEHTCSNYFSSKVNMHKATMK